MTIQDWLGLTLTALSILTIVGLAIKWVIRHYLKDIIHELKPNGGSSLKDQVNRLEKNLSSLEIQHQEYNEQRKAINLKIDHMYDALLKYISGSSK